MAMSRDARPGVEGLFRDMADNCARLDAPTYADLSAHVADRLPTHEVLQWMFEPYADARIADMVPLRFFAAVQRLCLEREAPGLALFYATLGGTPPSTPAARDACRAALLDVVEAHAPAIARGMEWFPQTNEVGRSVALLAILRETVDAWGLPVRLHEIGASAGLSLRADALADAGVVPAERPGIGPGPDIVERVGCDIAPLDPFRAEDRLLLTSFIWPDHVERFERLRRALDVAQEVPASLVAEDALRHVRALRLVPGSVLVVWHSAMWMYLDPQERHAIENALAALGATATSDAPLVHVALEPVSEVAGEQHVFHLRVASWPGLGEVPAGMTVTRATATPSGLPISWTVPCVGAVVHDDRGRLLVIQRGKEPAKGLWSVPGGRVHAGESFSAAVAREVREETGLDVSVGDMLGSAASPAPDGATYDIRDFRAHVVGSPVPRPGDDADDARWVGRAELRDLPMAPGILDALAEWRVLPTAP